MNDEDLEEWAQRIWAAVEYGRGGTRSLLAFIEEYERDGVVRVVGES